MNAESPKRNPLGRGLNALFGEQTDGAPASEAPSRAAQRVAIHLIAPSPLQPRHRFDDTALDELTQSIKEKDVLQPLLVRPAPSNPGHFEIIAGERRWRAAQKAMLHDVPVLVRDMADAEVLEVALIENLQRQDLSPIEEAKGFQRLIDQFSHTQEQVAGIVGKSRAHVANTLRLLTLPGDVQARIEAGELTAGQSRPLVGLRNAGTLAETIVKRGLNARQAERLAKDQGRSRKQRLTTPPHATKDADTRALELTLEKATGYKVNITFDGEGGTVTIRYGSLEQLDDIAMRLSNAPRAAKGAEGA